MLTIKLSMTIFFLISLMIFCISTLNSEESPSKMIFHLIIMILIICLIMYNQSKSSWMSISLFLSMVGGLMILFSMVASITPKIPTPSIKMFPFMVIMWIQFVITNFSSNSIQMSSINSFSFKMQFIMIIILILNFMLIFISKLIITPMKPFRSM